MRRVEAKDFEALFLSPRCLLDVRAPVEFRSGAAPGAINLPLLTDDERHHVGLEYKARGQQAAIELGHRLVNGEVKASRVKAWRSALERDEGALIYCFRGGLRSQIVHEWLAESGLERPVVDGGYKELRRFFLGVLEQVVPEMEFEVVSGLTGSGKTAFLYRSGRPFIDLEGLAAHRGSAFGALAPEQPSQSDFENKMAVELLRLRARGAVVLIEHESRMLGRRMLPPQVFAKIQSSPKVMLEVPFETRLENIFREYVVERCLDVESSARVHDGFVASVKAISHKLGGSRTQEVMADLRAARSTYESGQGLDGHRVWIAKLLRWYYDPMYIHGVNSAG